MEFESNKPIYRQITDYAYGKIMSGEWSPGERIPSVRELAVTLKVNTHTVLRAFDEMQQHGVIASRRGMGYFLADDAPEKVAAARRENFFAETLPRFVAEMKMLGIDPSQLKDFIS